MGEYLRKGLPRDDSQKKPSRSMRMRKKNSTKQKEAIIENIDYRLLDRPQS
jgi:hypothetical protein